MIRLKQNGVLILFDCGDIFKTKWGIDFVLVAVNLIPAPVSSTRGQHLC